MIIIRFIEMIANGIRSIFGGGYQTPEEVLRWRDEFLSRPAPKFPRTYKEAVLQDRLAMRQDWKALGDDMRTAMDKIKQEYPLPSEDQKSE